MATKCESCNDKAALGKKYGPKEMAKVCIDCAALLIQDGTCPMCRTEFDNPTHIGCLSTDTAPMEPAVGV